MVILVYRISFYFEDISLYISILNGILLVASIVLIVNWFIKRKINGKKFLAIETAYRMNNGGIFIFYWVMISSQNIKENFHENHFKFIPICCLWVFGVLLVITGGHLTNQVVSIIKKQYQLT